MFFDGLVIALVVVAAGIGAWRGFARLAAGIVAPIAAFAAGWPLSAEIPQVNRWLAFAALYLVITLLVFALAGAYRKRLERAKMEGWDNHLGFLLGAAQGAFVAVGLTLVALSLFHDLRPSVLRSNTGEWMGIAL